MLVCAPPPPPPPASPHLHTPIKGGGELVGLRERIEVEEGAQKRWGGGLAVEWDACPTAHNCRLFPWPLFSKWAGDLFPSPPSTYSDLESKDALMSDCGVHCLNLHVSCIFVCFCLSFYQSHSSNSLGFYPAPSTYLMRLPQPTSILIQPLWHPPNTHIALRN